VIAGHHQAVSFTERANKFCSIPPVDFKCDFLIKEKKGGGMLSLLPASAGFLFGLLFDSEDGGDMLLRTALCYNSEDHILHSHRCENLTSNEAWNMKF
jgi:hypothetical protein